MSSSMNLEADAIQHIDDTYEEEYIESFAPKAQEEVLSEIHTGDYEQNANQNGDIIKENNSSGNVVNEMDEKSGSVDISNEEEINVTSNELVEEVITGVESNILMEEEKIPSNSVDENIATEVDEEMDVASEEQLDVKEIEPIKHEDVVENVTVDPVNDEKLNVEEIIQDPEETEEIIVSDEPEELSHLEEPGEEAQNLEAAEIHETEEDKEVYEEETVTETSITLENKSAKEIKSEIDNSPVVENSEEKEDKIKNTSPTKAKDVKSLSSTYGHEENIANGDCCICSKKVYPMEKLSTNDRIFHKMCFRCTKCKSALSAGNFTFNHGRPYCTPHYVELFKKRGRYDEIDDNIEKEITTNDINDVLADELPAPDTTKNILAKFRDLQIGCGSNVNQNASVDSSDELPAPNTTKNLMERFSALGQEKSEGKCKPKIDIPRHTNGHSNGTSENKPIELPSDVVRANDPSQDDRPEQGITKNLVNRFREMENLTNN